MSRRCDICGKGPQYGNSVSHSKRHTKRVWLPNLKKTTVMVGSVPRTLRICMSCLNRSNRP